MNIMISLQDMVLFMVAVVGITLGVYLILALRNFIKVLKNINKLVEDNEDAITETVKHLPEISSNANAISTDLRANLGETGPRLASISEDISEIVKSLKESIANIGNTAYVVENGLVSTIAAVKENTDEIMLLIDFIKEMFSIAKKAFKK